MKCVFCHKGLAEGVSLHRINAKGQPGVWACGRHVGQTDAVVPDIVQDVIRILSPKGGSR